MDTPRRELTPLNRIRAARPRLRHEDGQAIVEYAFVIAGASIVLIGVLISSGLTDEFTELANSIVAALFGG
jgi:Flp pilus assembly pilin Flp